MSSYCLGPSVATVSLMAKPHTISAVQPATPPTVINRRLLKRNMLRAVTLLRKLSRRHSGRMRSSKMRAPAFGAFGCMSCAGLCRRAPAQATTVATTTPTTNSAMPVDPYSQSYSSCMPGTVYSPSITSSRNDGMPRKPTISPSPPPIRQASAANSTYRIAMAAFP